jgi:surface protein
MSNLSDQKLMSGRSQMVGFGATVPVPITLDPALHEGAFIYAADQNCYYSDGISWKIPSASVPVSRPTALTPITSEQKTQLRLTAFYSPTGLNQTGVYFEVAATEDGFENPLFTRTITSPDASLYQTNFPEDGLLPGQEFYWRALYTATEGQQSEFSFPYKQTYPELIDTPSPVTRDGATTGAVELTAFGSAFGLSYAQTEIQLWELTQDPAVDAPFQTVTSVLGPLVALPITLAEGQGYYWRGRHSGRVGSVGALTNSNWSSVRTILNGAKSMVLVFDPALALSRTINLPIGVYGGVVNVVVNWGDGTTNTYTSGGIRSKTYAAGVTGLVTVTISGQLEQYGGNTNIQGLVRVNNIGFGLGLTSLREMFRNCTVNTTYVNPALPPQVKSIQGMFINASPGFAVETLDVSMVENFSSCFSGNPTFNQPLAAWNTSSATNMSYMFYNNVLDVTFAFNQPIGGWNTSNVTDMSFMFCCENPRSGHAFNQDIGAWDVSKVTTMRQMFGIVVTGGGNVSIAFNNGGSPAINSWNTASLTDTFAMFCGQTGTNSGTSAFNQPLNNWNMSKVTNASQMFRGMKTFQGSLAGWNLSACTNLADMFSSSSFSGDVSGWVLPSNISGLFRNAWSFNNSSIINWDTSGVTNMSNLFNNAYAFNQPIGNWNVSNVTNMSGMFSTALAFNSTIGTWDTSKVTSMSYMFALQTVVAGSNAFNQPIGSWNTSSVTDMSFMFAKTSTVNTASVSFNQPIGDWDVSNVVTMEGMFARTNSGSSGVNAFNQDISNWKLRVAGVNLNNMFQLVAGTHSLSTENYSRLLTGWANSISLRNGPFSVLAGMGTRTYSSTIYAPDAVYKTAVAARTYLTNSNRLEVSGSSTIDGNGTYLFNTTTQLYTNPNSWYFVKVGTVWILRDNANVAQATQTSAADVSAPQLVTAWNGVLATGFVLRSGAVWTITDGGFV